jgi:N-acetyl-gamma-glutamyl-phosphate reductase
MIKKIQAGIIGGAGYTGGETLRLLLRHPNVEVAFVQSRSQAGKPVASIHTDLMGESEIRFTDSLEQKVDVVFLCLGHGESKDLLSEYSFDANTRIIDLGNDFRLNNSISDRTFIYGLPEWQREKIQYAQSIANPGCFATAIQLGLLPLAAQGLLGEIYTTGITGATGAGQKLQDTTQFNWRSNNISAYKTLTHQHLSEINQTLQVLQPGFSGHLHFVPWRGDFTRGIFVTSVVDTTMDLASLVNMYRSFYQTHPFTHLSDTMIDLKQVVNTNKCVIHLEQIDHKLAIHSSIDNLLKGASGQAVQNMNLMFGLPETSGLLLKASTF